MNARAVFSVLMFCCCGVYASSSFSQACCVVFAPSAIPALSTNQVLFVPITVTNTGDLTWPGYGDTSFALSYIILDKNMSWVAIGPSTLIPHTVMKGQSVNMTVQMHAPGNPGEYTVRWFMGHTDPNDQNYYYGSTTFDEKIEVNPEMLNLGALLSWFPGHLLPGPSIQSVAANGDNELTDWVTVGGINFGGNALGKLNLLFPDATYAASTSSWQDNQIFGFFDVSGEVDQSANLQVTRFGGAKSNLWPVKFVAGIDYVALPPGLIQVHCASAWGTFDQCTPGEMYPPDYYVGYHESNCCVSGDDGSDKYVLPTLHNGWVYADVILQELGSTGHTSVSSFTRGPAAQTMKIHWGIRLHNDVTYTVRVFIQGPVGVPFQ